ncbi:MAG: sigma-70 family RNA polymerase sigma factor [Xanthomonadales bacterium]|nr:sigma-70 family RNA polymerase sigma factor [Xanthomonadales bacterium]
MPKRPRAPQVESGGNRAGEAPQAGNDEVISLAAPRADDPFNALIARFGARVRSLVQQHCSGNQGLDADDVEQEVRIRLWKCLQRDRNAVLPASYIQRVVVSTVIDAVRRAQARPMDSIEDAGDESSWDLPEEAGPQRQASRQQQMAALRQALAELPERRRRLVELNLQGFGPSEAGELVGLSADAARKLMERGMKCLRERLEALAMELNDD